MQKFILFLIGIICFTNCKDTVKPEVNLEENRATSYSQNDGYITMKGDYVYYDNAAVFQTANDIYAVVIDENLQALEVQVKPFKKAATDMVPVTLRVRKFAKPKDEEGWPYRVEIKSILKVEKPKDNKEDVIKLSN